MNIGLKYEAMKSGKIDVINIFTTDGQLSHANLTTLKDDKHFFPSYYCATIVREETLEEHPELERILDERYTDGSENGRHELQSRRGTSHGTGSYCGVFKEKRFT